MKTILTSTALAACLAAVLPSQTRVVYVPDNQAGSGSCNVIPFGTTRSSNTWKNQKYQTILTTAQLGKTPGRICGLGFAPCGATLRSFDSIVIKMDHIKSSTLSTTFANNLTSKAVTVLSAKNYHWYQKPGSWNRIGLQKDFLYIPALGNVVIDIEVRGAHQTGSGLGFRRGSLQRIYAFGWSGNPPATGRSGLAALKMEVIFDMADAWLYGKGCAGSNNLVPALAYSAAPKIGTAFKVLLSNAPTPVAPAILLLGFSNASPLPVDLGSVGAAGCSLYVRPDFGLPAAATGGSASVALAIPNDARLVCGRFYNQFFVVDRKANKLGLTASNYGRGLIGH